MERERECLHVAAHANRSAEEGAKPAQRRAPAWRRFEITGYWHRASPLDARNCASGAAPVACGLMHELRAMGLRVIRAGYSAIEPGVR